MTCMKTQSMITPFINDKLDLKETEEFIDHIHSCSECREELEVYYALLTAMKQLDEDKNLSDDYNMELTAKLEKAQEKIIHVKFTYYRKKGALLLLILMVVFFTSFRYTNRDNEEEKMVAESTFRMRMSFRQERFDFYDSLLQMYYRETELEQ